MRILHKHNYKRNKITGWPTKSKEEKRAVLIEYSTDVKQIEEKLFKTSHTLEEYENQTTLMSRVLSCVKQ